MNIESEYAQELRALRQSVEAIPARKWREGFDDYLISARLYYHIFMGLEWFTSCFVKDAEEHKRTRKYALNWMGPVEEMPDQSTALADIDWIEAQIKNWSETVVAQEEQKIARAIYFLRHTRHHLGELFAVMRLMGVERPKWDWPNAQVRRLVTDPDSSTSK